ncbi:hypothetical protein [Streptomyces flaveolus]|uniref:hypothetical protein n=1 Tax=Streptomyces flaveolus TaxID=67297 RepID=UPI003408B042
MTAKPERPCGRTVNLHPSHKFMLGRTVYQCPGETPKTDRRTASTITDTELDQLYAELAALRAVARGYCPHCGRGDAAPTVEDWERERQRAQAAEADLAELTQARQHGAFTFCSQLVGHVTVAEFAKKISEKRTALAQREEAVQYANQQKQRAETAEATLTRVRETCDQLHRAAVLADDQPHSDRERGIIQAVTRVRAALEEPAPTAAPRATDEPEQRATLRGPDQPGPLADHS